MANDQGQPPSLGIETVGACRQALNTLEGFLLLVRLIEGNDFIEELECVDSATPGLVWVRDEDEICFYRQIAETLKSYLGMVQTLIGALHTRLKLNRQETYIRKLYPISGVSWGGIRATSYASVLFTILQEAWWQLNLCSTNRTDLDIDHIHEHAPTVEEVRKSWDALKSSWRGLCKLDWDELRVLIENERLSIVEMVSELSSGRPSPWIDAAEMITLMRSNGATSTSDDTIRRWKQKWGAESKPGTNHQSFRFNLIKLQELRVRYPSGWDEAKP